MAREKHIFLSIFGTRPEAIKMAPLIHQFNTQHQIKSVVCVTGQHRQMLDQMLSLFQITPHYDLNVMSKNQDLAEAFGQILLKVQNVIQEIKPDRIFVQGDTTTTLAASLAAYYAKIPVAHIEAGLRTRNIYSPWPEEINRKLTTSIADLHFAPTQQAANNLINEGVSPDAINVCGNTVIDALLFVANKINKDTALEERLSNQFSCLSPDKKTILVTCHRRESFGTGFVRIAEAIQQLSKRSDIQIIYPVHLNPNVQKTIVPLLKDLKNVNLIAPLDYLPFIYLMSKSYLILTDSGGIQEEAPSLGKPTLVLRETTERSEAVEAGTAILVGTDPDRIIEQAKSLLDNEENYMRMSQIQNPYGYGDAAIKITKRVMDSANI